ncbi:MULTISPECIES: efflux RND transporter periplasmic adaptor subunit [unclassified Janthinobacterium]|uniref:efflux RND transporter periplasmic adaptor subunit n=1 Tax=unclassified Janthinobacterium TaxID=2610881 RepID=UPI00088D8BDA|nr:MULTISPECIES: efflux RND transporter periplasmic adaptor subunit [unclassified Janthinobacterium]SDA38760.1 membrane fusion protein, multidrug efflux system [Janthinobacterium sp. 551a]SFA78684.1 membrane fusion protein, multidrug efflux system [Janthinobacterium sp. 344]
MKNVQQFSTLGTLIKPLAASLALAGLVAVSLAGCDSANSKVPDAPAAGGPPISAAAVVEKQITETQEFSGRLEAIERVEIRSRVGGFITAVNFKPGSEVKKGDVLFVIDPRPFQAEVSRAEGTAASARAKAELAKLELSRAEKLLAEKAIAQREFDEKASGLKELDANARSAQAAYEAARLNLSYTQVQAPISGRVSKAEITVGNLIDASAILTSVVSTDRIYASFDGDEDTYLRVAGTAQKGTPVTVKVGLANETGFPHEGKLEFVDNQLDPATGSVRMRATFANTDRQLVPGLFARIQLDGGNGPQAQNTALLISDRAVGTDQSRKYVYVVGADNKAEYRAVKLGPASDGLRVVREGLKAGEKIVVNGLQRVRPGAPVTPQMVAMDFDPTAPAAPAKPEVKDAKIAAKAASTTKE